MNTVTKPFNHPMLQALLTILLLEGFTTISVEILTIRQLIPFFGNSVLVTSIVIGLFLLFLALGYWRGGLHQTDIFYRLSQNFTFSLLWIGVGLAYGFISLYFLWSVETLHFPLLLSLVIYLLIVLAPIVYWLGQTIPLTTHLFSQSLGVSRISGRALFLSTIGSFLGAILTSLLLFQYLGVGWTVVINTCVLWMLIFYNRIYGKTSWLSLGLLLLAIWGIKLLNVDIEKNLFVKTNSYANYAVIETPSFEKILNINNSSSSQINQQHQAFPYIEFIRDLLFNKLNIHHQHMLVIGAGGFTLTANGTHENDVTYVDIDPDIQHIAESSFLHASIQGHFIGQDARAYFHQNPTRYNVIVADAYSHQYAIPVSLLTVDYFKDIAAHLTDGGLLVINLITRPFFNDDYSQRALNTIHAVFPYCTITPLNWNGTSDWVNMIYVCPHLARNKGVYRDDLTTAAVDFFKG